MGEGRASNH